MKAIKNSALKVRRKFDPIFKREAVNNWLSSGKSAEVVSEELGLSPGRLFLRGVAGPARCRPPGEPPRS